MSEGSADPMTPPEVAHLLGPPMTADHVRRLIELGLLRAYNYSSGARPRWWIYPEDLEEFRARARAAGGIAKLRAQAIAENEAARRAERREQWFASEAVRFLERETAGFMGRGRRPRQEHQAPAGPAPTAD